MKVYCVFSSTAYPIQYHLQVIFNNEKAAQNLADKKRDYGWRYEEFDVLDTVKDYYLSEYNEEDDK